MRVLVTGGTGFVGGHITAAVQQAGHDVRLLVRRPEQVPLTLGPLGAHVDDLVTGDVLDEAAVERAVKGCDAVVHAAAIFTFDARRAEEVLATNQRAAELILTTAAERGLDPVVHISSTVALTRYGGSGPDLPLGDIGLPYARSKLASEMVARRLQDEGAPVVTVYPGAVQGPHDPYRGVNSEAVRWAVRGLLPVYPPGSVHAVDVRTVGDTVLAVLEPGRGPRRYVVPGVAMDAALLFGTLEQVTGRRLRHAVVPGSLALAAARVTELLQRRLPRRWHYPADLEVIELALRDTRFDTRLTRDELGVEPVPFATTMRDTTRWLVESGRLPAKYAGKALSPQA
jgi:nucleoside-diphosphate-sugar epimerase